MKKLLHFLANIVRQGTDESSMRFAFVIFSLSNVIVVLSIALYIIIHAVKGTSIEWAGVAIGLAGAGAAITAMATQKVAQAKVEKDDKSV